MARPRNFDEDQVILDAMNVFWNHGYEGASIATLLNGVGLTKGSLYKAFNDKKSLFLRAMALYEERQIEPAVEILKDTAIEDGLDRIEKLFRAIPASVRSGDRRGCMLCTAAAGSTESDADIADVVHVLIERMRLGFEAALGHVDDVQERLEVSSMLNSQYVGLRILARAQLAPEKLDTCIDALMVLLKK